MYEAELASYAAVHHVRIVPKRLPINLHSGGELKAIGEAELAGRDLVFLNFGDGIHSLTSPESDGDPYELSFDLTRFTMVDAGSRVPVAEHSWLWVPNADVTYEFMEAGGPTRGVRQSR
jgi:hypothetical protein